METIQSYYIPLHWREIIDELHFFMEFLFYVYAKEILYKKVGLNTLGDFIETFSYIANLYSCVTFRVSLGIFRLYIIS